ncbi:MAG: hypothetical protein J7M29_02240 [Verrucomicrobia bacterium]|nr:hypothetical protein [Verrucomicrobiota bacterium]
MKSSCKSTGQRNLRWAAAAAACAAAACAARAQHVYYPTRVTFGPRFGFNIKVDFETAPALAPINPGPSAGGGVDREYDDGYVRVDSTGNQGGRTWNWGYENPAQVDLSNDAISMHAVTGMSAVQRKDITDDPHPGGEISVSRVIGKFGGALWGLEGGFGYTAVSLDDARSFGTTITSVTDTFSLGGIVPPAAPYHGSFQGPGPKIGDEPARNVETRAVTVTGSRSVDTDAYGIRFGPFLDVPMGEPLSLQLSGGLLVQYLDTDFTVRETLVFEDSSRRNQGGSKTSRDWLVGGYARGQLSLDLSERVGIYAAAEYQLLEDTDIRAGGSRATLSIGEAVYGSGGVIIRF